MDKDLKEALENIKHLRAALGLVLSGEANEGERKLAEMIRAEGADILKKHGESDDEMDVEFSERHGIYPQEAH